MDEAELAEAAMLARFEQHRRVPDQAIPALECHLGVGLGRLGQRQVDSRRLRLCRFNAALLELLLLLALQLLAQQQHLVTEVRALLLQPTHPSRLLLEQTSEIVPLGSQSLTLSALLYQRGPTLLDLLALTKKQTETEIMSGQEINLSGGMDLLDEWVMRANYREDEVVAPWRAAVLQSHLGLSVHGRLPLLLQRSPSISLEYPRHAQLGILATKKHTDGDVRPRN